jgi:hypothetical protein
MWYASGVCCICIRLRKSMVVVLLSGVCFSSTSRVVCMMVSGGSRLFLPDTERIGPLRSLTFLASGLFRGMQRILFFDLCYFTLVRPLALFFCLIMGLQHAENDERQV